MSISTIQDGRVGSVDMLVPADPSGWTVDDAREALHALIRALDAPAVYRSSLVEVERAQSWHLEVQGPTGVINTPPLRLSSLAYVWLSGAQCEMPGAGVQ